MTDSLVQAVPVGAAPVVLVRLETSLPATASFTGWVEARLPVLLGA